MPDRSRRRDRRPRGVQRDLIRPVALTDFVILAWRRDPATFDDTAWLIPAADLPQLVHTDVSKCFIGLRIDVIARGSRFNKYRIPREAVADVVERQMAL